MHRQKAQVTNQQNKMDGSRSLPAPKEPWKKREPIINRRGHRYPGQHGQRCHDENDSEVGKLLQWIELIEAVGFHRQMEGGIID